MEGVCKVFGRVLKVSDRCLEGVPKILFGSTIKLNLDFESGTPSPACYIDNVDQP